MHHQRDCTSKPKETRRCKWCKEFIRFQKIAEFGMHQLNCKSRPRKQESKSCKWYKQMITYSKIGEYMNHVSNCKSQPLKQEIC